jgi:DNA-directed RNA polymerase subunit E'
VRVVTLSLNEREPRDSKIGLTMRQSGMGSLLWLDEEYQKELQKEKGAERGGR